MTDNRFDPFSILSDNSTVTDGGIIATGSRVVLNLPAAPLRYLFSGWQSWSLTAWVNSDRAILPLLPKNQQSRVADPLYINDPRPNGSWYGAVELPSQQVLFLGSLGLESHVFLDGQSLIGSYESGTGDWFIASGDESVFMARYAELLGERLGKGLLKGTQRVWCSWYSLYTEINENRLLKILADLAPNHGSPPLPFDVFQIDDGWQTGIGDWEPNSKFPSGMDALAARIHASGCKAGLWLAPLLIVPSSGIYRAHRDWLLHDEKGNLVRAGFNWGEPLYALDTTHPAALEWLASLMKKIRAWGFEYAKLDFLYAGALPGKRYIDTPRETAYRSGLKTIRSALGNAYLLTCGAPILPSIGLCDGLRIGPDVAGTFASQRDDDLLMNYAMAGVRNALRTTANRLWLKPILNIDPDVVYFSKIQNNLTPLQKGLLQDMAHICSFKATSEIPAWLTDLERASLHDFLIQDPDIHQTGRIAFQVADHVVDFDQHIGMPPQPTSFMKFQGAILGWLATIPFLFRVLDKWGNRLLKRALKHNPA
jgi:alpha-galactosidase